MRQQRVAIFMDMQAAYGRDVLHGISKYIRAHEPWSVYGEPERVAAPMVHNLANWAGDGVIAQVWQPEFQKLLAQVPMKVVNVSQHLREMPFPSVVTDNARIGQMGARHLIDRGFRHFGFFGFAGHYNSELRAQAFRAELEKHGHTCSILETEAPQIVPERWETRQAELADWLGSLPKPAGVMTSNDVRARHITQVAVATGLRVPEELALVGVDNDVLVCELSNPPLSSVDVSAEQVGYEAAALLDRLMRGEPAPAAPILVPPRSVVVRRSSESLAISDPAVAEAMRYIYDHANTDLSVEDVVNAVPLSRRVLERRFRAILNTTIYDAVAGARIDRVKQSLMHDDAPTPQIAQRCGFRYVQQFNRMFKQLTGLTPTAYRRQFRTGAV